MAVNWGGVDSAHQLSSCEYLWWPRDQALRWRQRWPSGRRWWGSQLCPPPPPDGTEKKRIVSMCIYECFVSNYWIIRWMEDHQSGAGRDQVALFQQLWQERRRWGRGLLSNQPLLWRVVHQWRQSHVFRGRGSRSVRRGQEYTHPLCLQHKHNRRWLRRWRTERSDEINVFHPVMNEWGEGAMKQFDSRTTEWVVVSSDETAPVSMGGGVGTEESAWVSTLGELAPRGERTVTLGTRLGAFFIACRAVVVKTELHQTVKCVSDCSKSCNSNSNTHALTHALCTHAIRWTSPFDIFQLK